MKEVKPPSSYLTAFFMILFFTSYGQNGVIASGGGTISSGGSIQYSTGIIDFFNFSQQGYSFSEGLQQPYEISETLAYKESIDIGLRIGPNPFSTHFNIELVHKTSIPFYYILTNSEGRQLGYGLLGVKTIISGEQLISGTYFFTISDNKSFQKTYKLIKL
jgi:hypothetical protein